MGVLVTMGVVLAIQVFVVFAILGYLALAERKSKLVSWCLTGLVAVWVVVLAFESVTHYFVE